MQTGKCYPSLCSNILRSLLHTECAGNAVVMNKMSQTFLCSITTTAAAVIGAITTAITLLIVIKSLVAFTGDIIDSITATATTIV